MAIYLALRRCVYVYFVYIKNVSLDAEKGYLSQPSCLLFCHKYSASISHENQSKSRTQKHVFNVYFRVYLCKSNKYAKQ